ncbi:partial putative ATPase YjoB, partial [Anaerolineae bacterium]
MPYYNEYGEALDNSQTLKIEVMGRWIDKEWIEKRPDEQLITLLIPDSCLQQEALKDFDRSMNLQGNYHFRGTQPIECSVVVSIAAASLHTGKLTEKTGAFIYTFDPVEEGGSPVETLVMASYFTDDGHVVSVACIPEAFLPTWLAFANECVRLASALSPTSQVMIIGGRAPSFVPTVEWDDVILPAKLKNELMQDVESFFSTGIEVYRRLKLKPFRKLLLAGVPGTGKTMLCSALARWSLGREYLVIYVSGADRSGSSFWKIEQALSIAARSKVPTLILLEELDAYLHEEEKAMVLNVLDGAESAENEKGTLLIATTNYPEAIDERILKRPGRLDRIFIIPETRAQADAEQMLRQYLGVMWHDDHKELVPELVGYPGAFIREVAVY